MRSKEKRNFNPAHLTARYECLPYPVTGFLLSSLNRFVRRGLLENRTRGFCHFTHAQSQVSATALGGGGLLHLVPMRVGVGVPKELQPLKFKGVIMEVTEQVC
jgi:hypothetical protein